MRRPIPAQGDLFAAPQGDLYLGTPAQEEKPANIAVFVWLGITVLFILAGYAQGVEEAVRGAGYGLFWGGLYLIPSLAAYGRQCRTRGGVLVVNIFLGWTFIGWVVALAMAYGSKKER